MTKKVPMLFTPSGTFYSKVQFNTEDEVEKVVVKNSGFGSKNLGIARFKSEIFDAKLNVSVRDKILQLVNEIQINQVL